jgi:Uma2 family endonuclease
MSVSLPKPIAIPSSVPDDPDSPFPPLETGQHLTADEFLRRYEATPELENVELIEGVVHVASPVRAKYHGNHQQNFDGWLFYYTSRTPGTDGTGNSTTRLDLANVPQPDCTLYLLPEFGGAAHIDARGYLAGSPELVVEISASTISTDRNKKLPVYERNGIREYIICRVLDAQIDWFVLIDGKYSRITPAPDGTLRSITFPGLWLDTDALFRGDRAALIKTLDQGLAALEHAEFVTRIQPS